MRAIRRYDKCWKEKGTLLINLGCGPIQPEGWINIDCSNRARLAKHVPWLDTFLTQLKLIPPTEFSKNTVVFDVRKALPFENDSVAGFYAGELLEHLMPKEAERLLRECFRALIPGGHLRINVPDNYRFWKRYCDKYEKIINAPRDQWKDENLTKCIDMFFEYICVTKPILGSMGHYHKYAYDEVTLVLQMENVGFIKVKRRELHDSDIPNIEAVERKAYLVVEGLKPL